ncbi:MAG: hypothetical protein ACXVEF_23155 [Polyangiales bacterium]
MVELTEFEQGYLLGILATGASFGGTGREPQILLRLHTRHVALVRWLERVLEGSRLYGPYFHGGRQYLQWSARGSFLRQQLVPLLARHSNWLDDHARERFFTMCRAYGMSPEPPKGAGLTSPREEGV